MDDAQTDAVRDWLILHHAPGLGPATFSKLLDAFRTPAAVLAAGASELQSLGLNTPALDFIENPDWQSIECTLDWLADDNHYLLTLQDPGYPHLLREIPDPPPVLYVIGDPALLSSIQLGIVGSRNPDQSGVQNTENFARVLVDQGVTITSGMALGIDASAHRAALDRCGSTVAVLGNGPDIIYPARHRSLAAEIAAGGALVTEFPPGTAPDSSNFPRRNRIISGLATGVLVVQAAMRSGSLITARHALEQGREVFTIPGSIHNPLARGCHALIKQGAKLVETVQDIIEDIGPLAFAGQHADTPTAKANESCELDNDYRLLLDKLAYDPTSIDQLVELTGLTADSVSSMLLILEVRGMVSPCPGGLYIRTDQR